MHALDQVRVREEYVERVVGAWSLRNACVSFYKKRNTTHLAQWVSRRGDAVLISGFSEYSNGFHRLSWVRPELPADRLDTCPYVELGAAVQFSSNNIYHAFFHAVPAWRALRRLNAPVMIPLVDGHAGDWVGPNAWRSHAWEFALRALTTDSCSKIADRLRRLLVERCTCFGHVVGNTEAFEPRAAVSLPVLREFCRAALDNSARFVTGAGMWKGEADLRVLYVSRRGRRSLVNEGVVVATLRRQYSARTVSLESLTVSDQLHLLSRTQVLVAAHGQALAYMPFLALAERAAVIELTLPHTAETWRSRLMYSKWALSLHLAHFSAKTAFAPDCPPAATQKLHCRLVGHLGTLKAAMHDAISFMTSRKNISVAWCRHGGDIRLCGDQVSQHTS